MTVPHIHENDVAETWIAGTPHAMLVSKDAVEAKNCSVCVIGCRLGRK